MKRLVYLISFLLIAFAMHGQTDKQKKGFDLSNSLIPAEKIIDGGPPRDGIPSIDDPRFLKPSRVDYLEPSDKVLGVSFNYIEKAYPVKILNWHEIVNDYFGKKPVVVTYCPLCGSGLAYEAHVGGKDRSFGVSGLLYNNDLLLYDRQSESLWSQIEGKAIAGPLTGTSLNYIQTRVVTWKQWKKMYPYSQVLSVETGFDQDYGYSPYEGYENEKRLAFPTEHKDDRFHPKTWVVGIEVNGNYKVYPFSEIEKEGGLVNDKFEGKTLTIELKPETFYTKITTSENREYPSKVMYWFAWMAFHPESEVFLAED